MADSSVAESAHAELSVAGSALDVLGFSLRRGLSEIAELSVRVTDYAGEHPEPEKLIGQTAEFQVQRTADDQVHRFRGEVVSAVHTAEAPGVRSVSLVVASRLWRLGARTNCRRFLEMSTPDIVKQVLKDAGIPEGEQGWELAQSYAPHTMSVQYRETDLEYVHRLLAEAGIFFSTEATSDAIAVKFTDDGKGFGDAEVATIPFLMDFGARRLIDVIYQVDQAVCVRSDKVTLRDYDFTRPKLELEKSVESKDSGEHAGEIYQFPGRFTEPAQGNALAQVLLESLQADRDVIRGTTGVISLLPGYRFTLDEHPYQALNQEYLLVTTELRANRPLNFSGALGGGQVNLDYSCRFTAVPTARSPFRAPRREVAHRLPGLQTGLTTGPGGEEIHTDDHGRVTVKFAWDRESPTDDKSSSWMRTSQVPTGGSMLLPRVGWEVCVTYREGDMDQPYVMSRLYNGLTPPPYALPQNAGKMSLQTATTPGGGSSNELRMSDTKGNEEMFFNASRDMSILVGNNTTESIGNNSTTTVGSNHTLDVTDSMTNTVGTNHSLDVGGNQSIAATSLMVEQIAANHGLTVGGNRNQMIGGDHRRTVTGNATLEVGGNDINLIVGSVSENTLGNLEHNVGAALVEITKSNRSVLVAGSRTETNGAAKVIVAKGGRGVQASSAASSMVGAAFVSNVDGDRVDKASGPITEVAAGVNIVKAKNVTYEAQQALTVTMAAASLVMTPASVTIMGVSITLDGNALDLGIVMDN